MDDIVLHCVPPRSEGGLARGQLKPGGEGGLDDTCRHLHNTRTLYLLLFIVQMSLRDNNAMRREPDNAC